MTCNLRHPMDLRHPLWWLGFVAMRHFSLDYLLSQGLFCKICRDLCRIILFFLQVTSHKLTNLWVCEFVGTHNVVSLWGVPLVSFLWVTSHKLTNFWVCGDSRSCEFVRSDLRLVPMVTWPRSCGLLPTILFAVFLAYLLSFWRICCLFGVLAVFLVYLVSLSQVNSCTTALPLCLYSTPVQCLNEHMSLYMISYIHMNVRLCIQYIIYTWVHDWMHLAPEVQRKVYVYIYIYIYICVYVYLYVYLYIYTYMVQRKVYVCIYIYIYVCMYIYIYISLYIYIYMYMYTAQEWRNRTSNATN